MSFTTFTSGTPNVPQWSLERTDDGATLDIRLDYVGGGAFAGSVSERMRLCIARKRVSHSGATFVDGVYWGSSCFALPQMLPDVCEQMLASEQYISEGMPVAGYLPLARGMLRYLYMRMRSLN